MICRTCKKSRIDGRMAIWVCSLVVVLVACQTSSPPPTRAGVSATGAVPPVVDGPPEYIPDDLGRLPDPVPVTEPKSETGNPPSYRVFGKTYRTLDTTAGYDATGWASWYGRKFQGKRTSSGEAFDTLRLSAAHPSLPIPSYVEVTNLENGRRMIVRVNDRGPFHEGRIIDLSYAAAVKLGYAEAGTARVRVVALHGLPALYLHAGAFHRVDDAERLRGALEKLTGKRAQVVRLANENERPFRVRMGPLQGEKEANRLQALIATADHGVPEFFYGAPAEVSN